MNNESPKFTVSDADNQVGDLLHSQDVVNLYLKALENINRVHGKAFLVGRRIENSLSLLGLFDVLKDKLNINMDFVRLKPRESDQLVFVADNTEISNLLSWGPEFKSKEGLLRILLFFK